MHRQRPSSASSEELKTTPNNQLINNITTLTGFSGEQPVVPLPMKLIPLQMQLRHLLVRYFDTGWIGAGIKLGGHFQAFGRRRARDQTNDDSQAPSPVSSANPCAPPTKGNSPA